MSATVLTKNDIKMILSHQKQFINCKKEQIKILKLDIERLKVLGDS